MNASSMPNRSSRIFAIGARQFVVQDAFETSRCSGFSVSSLTPMTIVASISSFAGTVRITFRAPPARWPSSFSRVSRTPVDSTTTSTCISPQGSFAGSRSSVIRTRRPPTVIESWSARTSFSNTRITVSYLRR